MCKLCKTNSLYFPSFEIRVNVRVGFVLINKVEARNMVDVRVVIKVVTRVRFFNCHSKILKE